MKIKTCSVSVSSSKHLQKILGFSRSIASLWRRAANGKRHEKTTGRWARKRRMRRGAVCWRTGRQLWWWSRSKTKVSKTSKENFLLSSNMSSLIAGLGSALRRTWVHSATGGGGEGVTEGQWSRRGQWQIPTQMRNSSVGRCLLRSNPADPDGLQREQPAGGAAAFLLGQAGKGSASFCFSSDGNHI